MNRTQAESLIKRVFRNYQTQPPLPGHSATSSQLGKVYELYCLALFLQELGAEGFTLIYKGPANAPFKAAPGLINQRDPHFEVMDQSGSLIGKIFLNIEFLTLGSALHGARDRSRKHELDIVLSILSRFISSRYEMVSAVPESEFYLCYVDPKGNKYRQSPAFFSIGFRHWAP